MKLLLIMKLIILITTTFLLQASASSFGQRVTLSERNLPLEKMFHKIRKQTGYDFFFDGKLVAGIKPVSIHMSNVSLEEALNSLFAGQNLAYEINNRSVIIRKKEEEIFGQLIDRLQAIDVRGSIKDAEGRPLAGASISVKGKSQVVKSDDKGDFFIRNVGEKDILVISYVGYVPQEVQVDAERSINITLKEEVASLGEVSVSTGYQTIKAAKMTGAVSTVGAAELEKRNVINILDNLEGRIPGLVRYNGNTTIRGIGTMNANRAVLVVVDGIPIEGGVQNVNPYDVEQITVLKDAAAAAIYGARASNGVIVIDTKKAKKNGKVQVDFAANTSVFQKPDYSNFHYMNPAEQVDFEAKYADYYFNSGVRGTPATMINTFETNIEQGLAITPVQYAYYQNAKGQLSANALQERLAALKQNNFVQDYRENALENQLIQQYNLGIRSGNDRSQTNLVINYKNDNSGIINAYNRQLNLFFKGSYTVAKWMDLNYGINAILGYGRSHTNTNATNPFNVPAYYSLYNEDGARATYALDEFNVYSSYNKVFAAEPKLADMGYNHLDELSRDYANVQTRNTRYFLDWNIRPLSGLVIKPQFQYEDNRSQTSSYSEEQSYSMRKLINAYTTRNATTGVYTNLVPLSGRLRENNSNSPTYTARLQANYDRSFGKHSISAIAGTEFRQLRTYSRGNIFFGYNDQLQTQANTGMDYNAMRAISQTYWGAKIYPGVLFGTDVSGFSTRDEMHRFASGFANMTYTYNGKYNLFGSYRKDYADLFGGDEQYRGRPLWSAGVAWNVSREDFMSALSFVDDLKLRGSYGVTGNIALDYTAQLTATISGTNTFNSQPVANVTTPPNEKLRWEKTATANIGLDFSLLNNRLRGALDWYRKSGTDLFANTRLDATQGFTQMIINNGDMINNGYETTLSYDWFRPSDPKQAGWSTTLNFAYNKNRITFVDELVTNPAVLAGQGTFTMGRPVNSLYSYQYRGLDATGLPLWALSDGSLTTASVPSTDLQAVVFSGGADPKISIALNNELRYQGFSLNIFMVYYGGHYLRDNPPRLYNDVIYGAVPSYMGNSWTPTNTETIIPGFGEYYQQAANNNPLLFADRWVKRADFLRVRNLILGYQVPRALSSKAGISDVKLRFQVDNPNLQWSKSGLDIDPETRGLRAPTAYVFGVNFNF